MNSVIADSLFRLKNIIHKVTTSEITDESFIEREIRIWRASRERADMLTGEQYYIGLQDILQKKRTSIGENGEPVEVKNLPNNRIVDNQYKKMVDQKTNYLLGKPLTIQCENKTYQKLLTEIFDALFQKLLIKLGRGSFNCGKAWLYPYYDENGEFSFKCMRPYELKVNWKDEEHTALDYAIRIYDIVETKDNKDTIKQKVEVYVDDGIYYFDLSTSGRLSPCEPYHTNYFTIADNQYNWSKIPLICFKYHDNEIPLIVSLKSLQDAINQIESNFQDNMQEDARNTILVLINYDGENLGEFRKNLATYGAVKIRSDVSGHGDLKTLQVAVNSENYKVILKLLKDALIENAMGYDAKDDRLTGNPNQINIQSMYNDIDMDANAMESEYQLALKQLLWFINCHLKNTGKGDFFNEKVDFIFNRDTLINETEVIANCVKLQGILSQDTIIAQIPWVKDVEKEKELLGKEKEYNPFEVDNGQEESGVLEEKKSNTGASNI